MKKQPKVEEHYNRMVWVNPTTEKLRKDECLCLHCGSLKPGSSDNCSIAQEGYELCVKANIAFMVTCCPLWEDKNK